MKRACLLMLVAAAISGISNAASITVVDFSGTTNPGLPIEISSDIFSTFGPESAIFKWAAITGLADGPGTLNISGVALCGGATTIAPGVFAEATCGGTATFTVGSIVEFGETFGTGEITETSSGTGDQFTVTTTAIFGAQASKFLPNSGSESFSFVGLTPTGISNGNLIDATGYGNGLAAATTTPEPGTFGMVLCFGAILWKRNTIRGALRSKRS